MSGDCSDTLPELLRAADVLIREMNIVLLRLDSRMTEEERQRVHRAFLAHVDAKMAYRESGEVGR